MSQKDVNLNIVFRTIKEMASEIDRKSAKDNAYTPEKYELDSLKSMMTDLLELYKSYLVMMTDQPFYGLILSSLDTDINFNQRRFVDLKTKTDPVGFHINPLFIKNMSFSEFNGMIISEIIRLVFLHPTMFADFNKLKDPKIHDNLAFASDVDASNVIKRDVRLSSNGRITLSLPKDDVRTTSDITMETSKTPGEGEDMSYYFRFLDKFRKFDEIPPMQAPGDGGASNSSGEESENQVATPSNDKGEGGMDWETNNPGETKDKLIMIVNDAYNSLDERQRGLLSGSVASQIAKMNKPPEIPWQKYFKRMIGTIPDSYRKTKTRLNRLQPERFDLSGRLQNTIVDVVVALDTSGSMSDRDLSYCINEVFGILKGRKAKITIIEADAQIQRIYEVKKASDVILKMKGRGGTIFTPVIEYLNGTSKTHKTNRSFKHSVMIYFTDGFGESEIPKPKTYRNLWVVLNDEKHLSLRQPYGDVKKLVVPNSY